MTGELGRELSAWQSQDPLMLPSVPPLYVLCGDMSQRGEHLKEGPDTYREQRAVLSEVPE